MKDLMVVLGLHIVLINGMSLRNDGDHQLLLPPSCGDPQFNNSWTVKIHVAEDMRCFGVLISDRHVLTSADCMGISSSALVTFPFIPNHQGVAVKNNSETYLSGAASKPTLTVFELSQPIVAANFSPICVPKEEVLSNGVYYGTPCQIAGLAEAFIFCTPMMCDSTAENLIGYPFTYEESGQFFLYGFKSIYCSDNGTAVYISAGGFRQDLKEIVNEKSKPSVSKTTKTVDVVNGLCPFVRFKPLHGYFCTGSEQHPGFVIVPRNCAEWRVKNMTHADVMLECMDDQEVVSLDKSLIKCSVIDCSDLGSNATHKDTLINLERKCLPNANNEDNIKACSDVVHEISNRSDMPEADKKEAFPIDRCPDTDGFGSCKFPFMFEGRLRFECVTRHQGSVPECQDQSKEWKSCSELCPLMKYHSHPELIQDLQMIEKEAPNFADLENLGRSINGAQLMSIRLRNEAENDNTTLRPLVKFVGNMHGNEPTGRELLIHLAKYLVMAAKMGGKDRDSLAERAANVLRSTDLWILPTMNPDGFARGTEGNCIGGNFKAGRLNEGNVDLNRDFPTWRDLGLTDDELKVGRQQETVFMMDWIRKYPFVLSANFHDGAVVANYPYDDYRDSSFSARNGVSQTPDHEEFVHLAKTYSKHHPYMEDASEVCEHWGLFRDGITNGANWYEVEGGMQDFNYDFSNAMELTIEVSCCKYPRRDRLLAEWNNNIESLISYIEQAQRGLRGFVRDENNNAVAGADIQVQKVGSDDTWRGKNVTSDSQGRYWRILLPGHYKVRAAKDNRLLSEEYEVDLQDTPQHLDIRLLQIPTPPPLENVSN